MDQTLVTAVASGLALAGVLAVAGTAAARFARGMPHLGIAAVGAGVSVLAGRLTALPLALMLLTIGVAAGIAGALAWLVDRRAREVDAPVWPPVLLPDVAVLALGVAAASLLRPSTAIDLPLGPMGGLASNRAALIAFVVGVAAALLWSAPRLATRPLVQWVVVAATTAVVVALGAGSVAVRGEAVVPAFGVPDVIGLSLRAAAVGVVARRGVWPAIAAAAALGVGESLLRAQLSTGDAAVLPALAVLAWGLWTTARTPAVRPA